MKDVLREEFGCLGKGGSGQPLEIMKEVRGIMQKYACLHREEEGLKEALEKLGDLYINPMENLGKKETAEYFRAYNAVQAAGLIVYSMRQRRESRGCHDRRDYPSRDGGQEKMNWVTMENGRMTGGVLDEKT